MQTNNNTHSQGFTLVELVLVMAIGGLLAIIAFTGLHYMLQQKRFDASIEKEVQEFNYARNFALSGINEVGDGTDTTTVIAGTGVELDNAHLPNFPLVELETLYAYPDATGNADITTVDNVYPINAPVSTCPVAEHPSDRECQEKFFEVPDSLTLQYAANTDGSLTNSAPGHAVVYYVKTAQGLHVCEDINPTFESVSGACYWNTFPAPLDLKLGDPDGFTATIEIDNKTGFAKRID